MQVLSLQKAFGDCAFAIWRGDQNVHGTAGVAGLRVPFELPAWGQWAVKDLQEHCFLCGGCS